MTPQEKIAHLEGMLDQPEGKYTHDQIAARLKGLYAETGTPNRMEQADALRKKLGADDPGGPIVLKDYPPEPEKGPRGTRMMDMNPGKAPDPDNSFRARITRGSERIGLPKLGQAINWVNEGPAMALNKAMDAATLGLYGGATDQIAGASGVQLGPSHADRQAFQDKHPVIDAWSGALGQMSPYSLPSRIAGTLGKAVDPLTRIIGSRLTSLPGRAVTKIGEGAVVGAGTGVGSEAINSVATGSEFDPARAAKTGAAVGGGLATLTGGARNLGRAIGSRNEDIITLDRGGLEPSPVPFRPVMRKDQPILSQLPVLSEPPLVGKASPRTRARAGRDAAEEINADVDALKKANSKRFGELQNERYAAQGNRPATYDPILAEIAKRQAGRPAEDSTRAGLASVRNELNDYMPQEPKIPPATQLRLDDLEAMLPAASPASRKGIEAAIARERSMLPPPREPLPFDAKALDKLRKYTDAKVASGEIPKGDVDFVQLSKLMRDQLEQVAPGIAKLNKDYSDTKKGFARTRNLLGTGKGSPREGSETPIEAATRRITERAEDTKSAGSRESTKDGHYIDRLIAEGRPKVLEGSAVPPEFSYQAKLDVPRYQLSQENLQANPSRLFSGGGMSPLLAPLRLGALTGPRVVYPLARRFGQTDLGGKGVAVDQLIGAVRQRREKKKKPSGSGN